MVALAIGGIVVALAHRSFGAAADFAVALRRSGAAHEEVMATRDVLTRVLGSVDAAAGGSAGFRASPSRIVTTTWLDGARRDVEVVVRERRLVVALQRDTLRLMRAMDFAAEYLLEFGAEARWVRGWQSAVSAPLAVRLRIARGDFSGITDTLLIAIGPRG